ncbi:uncharacterized protein LOC102802286 [Saccoglossus kowalevskii]|uniref:Transcription initiation factor IIA subunit 1-like n=1 Tax=Saccoglossus kowalevskii TaxID=10224 RepID=A0ABM0MQ56_SACKO|nr:PREDICTED: transcription initiation factor IIA subunit 1-like [Saccoglossus kowalevskii]
MAQNSVSKLYQSVIDDVINNVRESFLDEGVDDQVLQELKHIWESKLAQSKALDQQNDTVLVQYAARSAAEPTMSASAQAATLALPEGILAYQPQQLTSSVALPTATEIRNSCCKVDIP